MSNPDLKVRYVPLSDIKLLEMNFKNHDVKGVEQSLNRFGFVDPIGVNPTTGNAYDGNGRTKVLTDMRRRWLEGLPVAVPKYVKVRDKEWLVPTIEVELDETNEIALAGALNRLNELGGYDEAKMLEVLQYLNENDALDATGFTNDDLDLLIEQLNQVPPSLDELKEKHGSSEDFDEFTANFGLKLSLPVHKRWQEFWDNLSGSPDERILYVLERCK